MAKASIKPESEKPVSVQGVTSLATQTSNVPAGYNPDQYDDVNRDLQTPVLGLINKVGPLSRTFPKNVGEFALGENLLLGESAQVIPVGILKFFIESRRDGVNLKYGDGIIAKRFATANEAYQQGYAVDFDSNCENRVEESSIIAWLVIAPEGDESGEFFVSGPGGLKLAEAKTTIRRGSHRAVFRPLLNHANRKALSEGMVTKGLTANELFAKAEAYNTIWTVSPRHEIDDKKNQDWFEFAIAKTKALTPEQVAWVKENYGNTRLT